MPTRERPYQARWAAEIETAFQELRAAFPQRMNSVLGVMPTGAGKTRGAIPIIARKRAEGRRVAFVAELEESIDDTVSKIQDEGIWCGVIKAGRASDPLCRVQVCSLKTLVSRPQEIPPCDFVILDEAHGIAARTPLELFQTWQPRDLLGLTATPERSDKKALNTMFHRLIVGPAVTWLQSHGLCDCGHEPSTLSLSPSPDFDGDDPIACEMCAAVTPYLVRTRCFAPAKFQEKHPAWDPVSAYQAHLAGRRVLALCTTIKQALRVVDEALAAGIQAECIHGGTDSDIRAGARERLTTSEGGFILTGVDVFTQAWDCPAVDGLLFVRKFGTLTPWLQAWGRGMRPSGCKHELIGVDLWGSYWLHGPPELNRVWNLDGQPVNPDGAIRNARCQTCGYIGTPGLQVCPLCGGPMVNPRPEPVVERKTLYDMTSIPDAIKDAEWLSMMLGKCLKTVIPAMKKKGTWHPAPGVNEGHYAAGWAFRRFLEKFGREPLNAGMGVQ